MLIFNVFTYEVGERIFRIFKFKFLVTFSVASLGLALFVLEVSRAFQFWIFISDTMKACIIHRKHFSPTLFATKPWGIRRISHIHYIKLFNNFFRYVFRYFTAPTNEFDVPVLVFLFRVRSN